VGSAVLVAERLIERLQTPFVLGNNEVLVTASIGIASGTLGDLPEDLLRDADTAMYRAKARSKASYLVFEPRMNARALQQLRLASDLRRAIEREEFVLHYQPKVELSSGKIVGVEALLRWEHPERGLAPPEEFIPLSEEMGLIVPIGQWVIEEACQKLARWQEQCLGDPGAPFTVSVNLSARQLQQPRLAQEIAQTLRACEVDPNGLELEITESIIMEYDEIILAKLEELKRLGVRLGIDDFGTGYSSLSHLNRLPIDVLKIDRSFIEGLNKDTKAGLITSATINLAHALNLEVVAEGVETVEQLAQLRKLRCDMAQGYYFSKPLTNEEISSLMKTGLLPNPASRAESNCLQRIEDI
jgi:EAL domain-containing protein (putative c-di-GMP-specific phosphodiesterase class I)